MVHVKHTCTIIQNLDEPIIVLLSQVSLVGMLGANLGLFSPNRTACDHNRNFPQRWKRRDTVF